MLEAKSVPKPPLPWVKTALISLDWRLIPLANWHDTLVNRMTDGNLRVRFRPAETAHLRFVAGKIELDHRLGWMQARRPRQNRLGSMIDSVRPVALGKFDEKAGSCSTRRPDRPRSHDRCRGPTVGENRWRDH